ncbi:hypothetical protein R5R35_010155 [Gryllus longicercus]|uniref:CCHC-type domain-containing protein n=1 Tax=Gryllus longicercus TaxID=2509291 RepID=A0AAN9VET0_9ORTH
MVCKEDVVTWFKELTSHKRIDVMCTLLNMCLPFELRFLGTCLEDLGKRDFHDLRDVENRANNVSELSDLQCFSDKRTQRKLALYLALLHSCNHACSNGLYKILANFDFGEINNLTNNSSEENPLDELLLLYTLALNHPAFTYEQRAMFGNILVKLQDEENKLYAARHSVGIGLVYVKNPMQACVPCPASDEQGQVGPCTGLTMPPTHPADLKGRNSLPPGLNLPPGLSLPPDHQMTATSYVHVTFPSAGHQQLPAVQWHGAPLMMTSLCSTLPSEVQAGGEVSPYPSSPLMSRQSSPSQSGSPSRAASPARLGPLPPPPSQQQQQPQSQQQPQPPQATPSQQPQQTPQQQPQQVPALGGGDRSQGFKGPLPVRRPERSTNSAVHRQNCIDVSMSAPPSTAAPHQRGTMTRKSSTEPVDSLRETLGKEMPNFLQNLQNYTSDELRRMSDDELKDLGLPAGAIHQLRAIVTKLNNTNGISTLDKREPGPAVNRRKQENNADEVAERKNQHAAPVLQRINRFPLEGAPMVYPPPSLLSAPAAPCFTCFVPVTSAPGRYPPQPQPYCCVGHGMRGLRIDDSARHCSNSSSAASDSSSASHSPPDTPSMPTTPQWERVYPGKEINLGERWSPGCEDHTEKDRRLTEPTEKPGGEETNSGAPSSQPPGVHATNISVTSSTTANNNNTTTSSNNNSSSSSSSTNSNSNNRPRVPGLGRGKPTPPGLQLPRGRGPNPTTVILEGNHKTLPSCRREGPTMNGAQPPPRTSHPPPTPPHDDRKMYFVPSDMAHTYSTVNSTSQPPPPQYSGGTCGNNPQHRPADMSGGSSNVPYSPATAAAFLPHTHFNALRSTGSLFPSFAHSSYMRPFPFSPNGELVYQYHGPQTPPPPPPTAFIPTPMVAAFSPVVPPPKVSCYNCGSQSHHASDCKDPTMEEMTKPGQYRIDYVPYQKPGECSSEK